VTTSCQIGPNGPTVGDGEGRSLGSEMSLGTGGAVTQNPPQVIEPLVEGSRTTEDIATLVANHQLLAGLPGDMVALVTGCARNVAVKPGEFLLVEGEAAETLYLLRRGRVSLEVRSPGRKPLVIETLGPGDGVGWSWLFPPYRWQFDARAIEPVGAIAVDAPCLRSKAEADPVFGYQLMKRFASVMVARLHASQSCLLGIQGREKVTKSIPHDYASWISKRWREP